RDKDGLGHEDAVRDVLVSVLVSPNFLYRVDSITSPLSPPGRGVGGEGSVQPLSDYALASRLSYFLWSSMPDAELLAHAAAGDLHQPEVLIAQTRRMVKDKRIRGLATEFPGHWLDFPSFRGTQRRGPRAFQDLHRRAAQGDVRGAALLLPRRGAGGPLGARFLVCQAHLRQCRAGRALRHAQAERRAGRLGADRG